MIQAVFWDNDGVLVDTEALYFQASREVLDRVGITLDRETFVRISLDQGGSVFALAAQKEVTPEGLRSLRDDRNQRYSLLLQKGVRVIDGVRETLDRLKGQVVMGVVTSCRREHFRLIHAASGLLGYFDFVLTREDYVRSKPDPEPYLTAVDQNGLDPSRCVIVEDTRRGLAAARAARIRCLVIPNALAQGGSFTGAYRILDSIREVPGAVLGGERRAEPPGRHAT